MSIRTFVAAAAVAGSLATVASATTPSYSFCFDPVTLSGGQSVSLTLNNLSGTLTGFSIEFTFNPSPGSGAWASDAAFVLSDGTQWGGFNVLFGSQFQALWSFDGPGSAAAGTYTDTRSDAPPLVYNPGTSYTFIFGNGFSFSGPVDYSNICVTLFGVVPAPGAVALLGLGGLVGMRRRRA
jgi:MYXO-CTERM domain-containing protein